MKTLIKILKVLVLVLLIVMAIPFTIYHLLNGVGRKDAREVADFINQWVNKTKGVHKTNNPYKP